MTGTLGTAVSLWSQLYKHNMLLIVPH
eukprot:SAG31_NODE_17858_length_655_cov_1.293165_1_plen_26_part_10